MFSCFWFLLVYVFDGGTWVLYSEMSGGHRHFSGWCTHLLHIEPPK